MNKKKIEPKKNKTKKTVVFEFQNAFRLLIELTLSLKFFKNKKLTRLANKNEKQKKLISYCKHQRSQAIIDIDAFDFFLLDQVHANRLRSKLT